MRSWLRLVRTFDPATLVAVVVAGLLPTALILAISSFALTGMSIELGDLLEEPHLERVRTQAQLLSAEIDARLGAWRGALREVVSSRGEATPPPIGAEGLLSLVWIPSRQPGVRSPGRDERADFAEVVLRSLPDLSAPEERREILRAVSSLPPSLEDDLGFSYAVEATLELGGDRLDPLAVLASPSLDPETLDAWGATVPGGRVELPGWSVPVLLQLDAASPPVTAPRLVEGDPGRFQLVLPEVGTGRIVAEFATEPFLADALAATLAERGESEAVFTVLRPFGSAEATPGRAWASWPLPPPFSTSHQLVTGTFGADIPSPLALLQRLEGFRLVWAGLLLVVLAVGVSLVLGALASRRVRISSEKDQFLRLVSHELRTPIASIRMIAETLGLDRIRSEEDRAEFIALLESESARLADLVERVLEFGRGEAGARRREVVADANELVERTVERFQEGERTRNPEGDPGPIRLRADTRFHPVLLDREAISGVVENLLSNARKYAPSGSSIEVAVEEEAGRLRISVSDEGEGIPRREQKRIFRSFYRGAPRGGERGSPAPPGFGLGLAYCQQVARAHRGRMSLRSAPGRGSTFTLEIPLEAGRPEGADDGADPHRRG
ncbi:MAG: sensor histidine kinase [Planctomycetota bacterium]